MKDAYGREINYLRMSVTQRCSLHCAYCSKSEGKCLKEKELSADALIAIARAAASLGFNKLRITGGEPLIRRDITDIVSGIASLGTYKDIAMTTNAQMLADSAKELKSAGLMRVNIGIPSLNADSYRAITGGELDGALKGIEAAFSAGLTPIKLNTVLIKGENDSELEDFFALVRDYPLQLRFIELMPMGDASCEGGDKKEGVTASEVLSRAPFLVPVSGESSSPAKVYTAQGFKGTVGFISPMTHSFCESCNRMRVTGDGFLRPCLGDNTELPLGDCITDDKAIAARIAEAIKNKPKQNCFGKDFLTNRKMNAIGG